MPTRPRLTQLSIGQRAEVTTIDCPNRELRNKLLSMGLVAGVTVELAGVAPLGDPMKIDVFGSQLALRRSEAQHIVIAASPTAAERK